MPLLDFRNTNSLWASVLVETLVRLGLQTAVVSPGSRSTPLTMALASHPKVDAVPILDERSAAFFGLGVAKRTGLPVVLVCTSGTAGANYYPAVIEAKESRVPLLVLTADRPPELRDCASGQTIDQQKLFGNFPNWYAELATPLPDLEMLRYLRQTLLQAWTRTLVPTAGPVHLNCPFRDPLAPLTDGSVAHLEEAIDNSFFASIASKPPCCNYGLKSASSFNSPTFLDRRTGLIWAGISTFRCSTAYCRAVAILGDNLKTGPVQWRKGLSPLRNHEGTQHYLVTTYDIRPATTQFV